MKVIWDASDIRPGLEFGHPGCRETSLIGYLAPGSNREGYTFISMADGMVQPGMTKEALAKVLTDAGAMPLALMTALHFNFGK
jgi:hypothetical protein